MAAGPGDLTKGKDKDKDAKDSNAENEKLAGFSWADELNRVKKIWGSPSEPLAPVQLYTITLVVYI